MEINEECFLESNKVCCLSLHVSWYITRKDLVSFNKLGPFGQHAFVHIYMFLVKPDENYSFWYQNDNDILVFCLKTQKEHKWSLFRQWSAFSPLCIVTIFAVHVKVLVARMLQREAFVRRGWSNAKDKQFLRGLQWTSVSGRVHAEAGENCEEGEAERSWYGLTTLHWPISPWLLWGAG